MVRGLARLFGAVLEEDSLDELNELSRRLCHVDSTINITILPREQITTVERGCKTCVFRFSKKLKT